MQEKKFEREPLPVRHDFAATHSRRRIVPRRGVTVGLCIAVLALFAVPGFILAHAGIQATVDDALVRWIHASRGSETPFKDRQCPQESAWQRPDGAIDPALPREDTLAYRLSRAVQIDTSVRDDESSPDDDPELWQARFQPFRDFLEDTFPRVHELGGKVSRELVHQHGILYTWRGSDESLKPILLMAHQDVVPVDPETIDKWVRPPFAGALDNGTVIGRGTTDIKNLVISILSTLEALLESEFQPERTILVSFGYDEECGGRFGGKYLGQRIEELHGKDSLAMIVDEGNPVMSPSDRLGFGIPLAVPGIEEKGQLHARIRIEAPGGHSSMPPRRTTVGLLSDIISNIENGDNLREPVIPDLDSAYLKTLQCLRDAVPGFPQSIRQALKHLEWASHSSTPDLVEASATLIHSTTARTMAFLGLQLDSRRRARIGRAKRALLAAMPENKKLPWSTTQTPTIFHGGVKLNAIPASAQVEIDHRVALHHTIEYIQQWYSVRLLAFARKHSLSLSAWGNDTYTPPKAPLGRITLELGRNPLRPAPRTPTSGPNAHAWRLFQSLIRSAWQPASDATNPLDLEIIVAPSQMNGNTDTRWMWNLSHNIFRFMPASLLPDSFPGRAAFEGVHNINEHYRTDGLVHAVRFYADLIVAADKDRKL